MNLFMDATQEVLSMLLRHEVDFIVIGGYAVIFHGYHRTTGDVDLWLKPDNENKRKLIQALEGFGIEKSALQELERQDFQQHLAFHIGEDPEKIEFLTYIRGLTYEEADSEKTMAAIDHLNIPFLSLDHLVLSKIATGRLRDQADIEELQKIRKSKG
jgi:predicted nucleotidyltransferase